MQEPMGINRLADMFMGNPQPLAQKVEQAQKQTPPGQIPPDLAEALALQQIQEARQHAQNQQAMQAGGPQPTVMDKLRQLLQPQPAMQAQPGMPPQMAQGQPQMPPQGMPPVQAAHGGSIAQLMSNLGQHYGGGGIVAFSGGGDEGLDDGPEWGAALRATRQAKEAEARKKLEEERARNMAQVNAQPEEMRPVMRNDPRLMGATPAAETVAPSASAEPALQALALLAAQQKQMPQTAPHRAAAAQQIQGTPYDRMDATRRADFPQVSQEDQILRERMGQDKEAERRAEIARINEMIGKPDNSAVMDTIAALKAKRDRAQASADPLMELLGGIASAKPGQKWWQSGVAGSEAAASKAAQREAADTAYLEQILGHQQKVADTDRAYKTQLYTASAAAADRAAKEVYDAAIAVGQSKQEATKLAQEERLKMLEIASHEKIAANTNATTLAASAARADTASDRATRDAYKTRLASIDRELAPLLKMPFGANKDTIATLQAEKAKLIKAMDAATGIATMMPAPGAPQSPGGTTSGWGKAQVVK